MKVNIPSSEESKMKKRKKLLNFFVGLVIGIIVFGLGGSRLLWWGIEEVEIYTWIALGAGVLAFGFMAMLFGSDFWKTMSKLLGY